MTTLRMATGFAANSREAAAIDTWAESIATLSGGAHQVQVYHAGELVGAFEVLDAVAAGQVDMGWSQPYVNFPDLAPLRLGGVGGLGAAPSEALHATLASGAGGLFATSGLRYLGAAFTDASVLMAGAGTSLPSDMIGQKIYASSPEEQAFLDALGATPLFLAFAELNPALQTGVLDGALVPAAYAVPANLTDVTDVQLAFPADAAPAYRYAALTIAPDVYDGLPADLRLLLDQQTGLAFAADMGRHFLDQYTQNIQTLDMASDGLQAVSGADLAAWRVAIGAFRDAQAADLTGLAADLLAAFGTSGPTEVAGAAGPDSLPGTAGDDLITGLAGNDTLAGFAGEDTLDAGAGNDLAYAGPGADVLTGGPGQDTLYGAGGGDTIRGDAGDDLLGGGPGDDSLAGGDGNDAIWTAAGNDTADGGGGDDTLGGALGDDSLEGGTGDDALWGAAGHDTLSGGAGSDTLGGADGDDALDGGDDDDELWGAAGNDTLEGGVGFDQVGGGTGADSIDGGAGNDTLSGGVGNDTILGGSGDDLIFGAGGDDSLEGGTGSDTIYAGPGADVLVFSLRHGADVVEGFSLAEDTLQLNYVRLTRALTPAELVAQFGGDVGADYVLDLGNGDSITLVGMAGITGLEDAIDFI